MGQNRKVVNGHHSPDSSDSENGPTEKSQYLPREFHLAILSIVTEGDRISCGRQEKCKLNDSSLVVPGSKKIEYKNRFWHEHCFVCDDCGKILGVGKFSPKGEHMYCQACYRNNFIKLCTKCNKLTFEGVLYKDEPYHRECFRCTRCTRKIAGLPFMTLEQNPTSHYCMECYAKHYAPKCSSCSLPIAALGKIKYVKYGDECWHSDCFRCETCNDILPSDSFFRHDNCLVCYGCLKRSFAHRESKA